MAYTIQAMRENGRERNREKDRESCGVGRAIRVEREHRDLRHKRQRVTVGDHALHLMLCCLSSCTAIIRLPCVPNVHEHMHVSAHTHTHTHTHTL